MDEIVRCKTCIEKLRANVSVPAKNFVFCTGKVRD